MARRTTTGLLTFAVALSAALAGGSLARADPALPLPSRVARFLELLRAVSPLAGDLGASASRRSDPPSAGAGADRLDLLLGAPRKLYLAADDGERVTVEGPDGTIVAPRPLPPNPRVAEDFEAVLLALQAGRAADAAVDLALARIARDPDAAGDFRIHLLSGLVGFARGEPGVALSFFEAARRAAGGDLPSRLLVGFLQLRSGDPAQAIEPLAEALRIAPGNAVVRELLAEANLRSGHPARSVLLLDPLVRADPAAARPALLLARSLLAAKRPRDALVRLEKVTGDQQIRFAADCLAARAHLALGETDLALLRARSAAALEPGDLLPKTLQATALGAAGRTAEALAVSLALTGSHPEAPTAWRTHALVCEKLGDLEGAETAARRWLSLSPGQGAPVLLLARILVKAGRPDAAVACLDELVGRQPELAAAHRQLGAACLAAGRTERAKASFRTFLEQSSEGPAARNVRELLKTLDVPANVTPK